MKHFWSLAIAAVLFAFTAQAGPLNTPTLSGTQTVQPPPKMPGASSGLGDSKVNPAPGIKRVGQEVIVNFLEGDPDRPTVVGKTNPTSFQSPTGSNTTHKPRHPPQPCKGCAVSDY